MLFDRLIPYNKLKCSKYPYSPDDVDDVYKLFPCRSRLCMPFTACLDSYYYFDNTLYFLVLVLDKHSLLSKIDKTE